MPHDPQAQSVLDQVLTETGREHGDPQPTAVELLAGVARHGYQVVPASAEAARRSMFEPRTGIPPLWMQTIEMNPARDVVSAVIVVDLLNLHQVADLLGITQIELDEMILHTTSVQAWLRIDVTSVLALRRAIGKLTDIDARTIPGAYEALFPVEILMEDD